MPKTILLLISVALIVFDSSWAAYYHWNESSMHPLAFNLSAILAGIGVAGLTIYLRINHA